MKTSRDKKQLNGKEGMALTKGAQTPPATASAMKSPQKEDPKKPPCRPPSWIQTHSSDGMELKTWPEWR